MPTPQGLFWTRKTFACSNCEVVAFYKDAGIEWSYFIAVFWRDFRMDLRSAIGVDPDSKCLVCSFVGLLKLFAYE